MPRQYRDFNNFVTFKKEGLDVYANGNKIGTFSQQEFTTPNTILLFSMRNNGTISNPFQGYIASCKFSSGGALLKEYIAVRKGTIGYLYDKISKQLSVKSRTKQRLFLTAGSIFSFKERLFSNSFTRFLKLTKFIYPVSGTEFLLQ